MRNTPVVLTALMILMTVTPALAQQKGQVGLTLGYPASAGLQWHPTERVAARVTASYAHASTETSISIPTFPLVLFPTETTTTSSVVSLGLSGLFYLSKGDDVRTFVSPRYTYLHSTADRDPGLSGLSEPGQSTYAVGGSFGVQYSPKPAFSVFGEAGLEYQRHDDAVLDGTSKARILGTRAGVGVIFYFRR
jgi:hypothetical protein